MAPPPHPPAQRPAFTAATTPARPQPHPPVSCSIWRTVAPPLPMRSAVSLTLRISLQRNVGEKESTSACGAGRAPLRSCRGGQEASPGVKIRNKKSTGQEYKKKMACVLQVARGCKGRATPQQVKRVPRHPTMACRHANPFRHAQNKGSEQKKNQGRECHVACMLCLLHIHARTTCCFMQTAPTPNVKTPLPPANAGSPEDRVPAFRAAPLLASGRLASHLPPLWLCW